uniref:DUF881 domain-containing protein n=1 Tax=Ezakiella massiliensis TaxID=1852374 RepID=UPI00094E48FF|nr:DUF881 domain-containing protein [Ezakiella massiliensis]
MKINKSIIIVTVFMSILFGLSLKMDVETEDLDKEFVGENKNKELAIVNEQIRVNKEIISDLNEKVLSLKSLQSPEVMEDHLKHERDKYQELACKTDLTGQGLEIILEDSKDSVFQNTNFGIVHDIDIINIINDLRSNGAEAISINDIRVIETTDVKCGGPVVRIDGVPKAVPFVIRAIGDAEKLYAGLYDTNGYLKLLEEVYSIKVEIKKSDEILIPKKVR